MLPQGLRCSRRPKRSSSRSKRRAPTHELEEAAPAEAARRAASHRRRAARARGARNLAGGDRRSADSSSGLGILAQSTQQRATTSASWSSTRSRGARHHVVEEKRRRAAGRTIPPARIVFVKPTSFMNLSGTPVRLIASWYRTPPAGVLVVSDDMDLPFGKLRMRPSGGHGGHNGLRSIIATIGEELSTHSRRPRAPGVRQRRSRARPVQRRRTRACCRRSSPRPPTASMLWLDEGLEAGDALRQYVGHVYGTTARGT